MSAEDTAPLYIAAAVVISLIGLVIFALRERSGQKLKEPIRPPRESWD